MKNIFLLIIFALVGLTTFAQKNSYQLSSHILDISKGTPAAEVSIKLEKYNEQTNLWSFVDEKKQTKTVGLPIFLV